MNSRTLLKDLVGRWKGTNRLWLSPDDPARESETQASLELVAQGAFLTVRNTWKDGDKSHDGLLIVRNTSEPGPEDMRWVDSFHTGGQFMSFRGEEDDEGRVVALGSYAAPPGPDWGWRITLAVDGADQWSLVMHNITPDGEEALAVEAIYSRE